METGHVLLAVPDTHIVLEPSAEGYTSSIAASISITVPSSTSQFPAGYRQPGITVSLVRNVTPKCISLNPRNGEKQGLRSKRLWKKESTSIQSPFSSLRSLDTSLETLVQCNIQHSPDEICSVDEDTTCLKFTFSLPVPDSIPATANTSLGDVSYAIEAKVIPSADLNEQPLHVSQPVRILRSVVPATVSHLRKYPGDKVVTELFMTPTAHHSRSHRKHKASYSVQWLAQSTIMSGVRESEVKYLVANGFKWEVDEVAKFLSISKAGSPEDSETKIICREQHVRQLCTGHGKGRWVASGTINEGSDRIEIPFDISIPTEAMAADDSSASSYFWQDEPSSGGEILAVTVEHLLTLEVVTGEDTFHRQTGDLVERQCRVKSYKAVFPFSVREYVEENFSVTDSLPKYGEAYLFPPRYS
ncbi:hypothetical protein BDW59DRAFT_160933 [Aspergillus cavernicola]|uniref:Arrestin-like N-terminal domain-containing protein n=1 Tax=Aspergillus cavernicola TaxID=176166 RepID=A0ABR4IGP4_9EURO